MPSTVCQGLQSCLELWLMEPRVLKNKLVPPTSTYSQSTPWPQSPKPLATQKNNEKLCDEKNNNRNSSHASSDFHGKSNSNGDVGGWCFLQALSQTSHSTRSCKEEHEREKEVYVPPAMKRPSSMLSSKSLEMCTESLGSETGCHIGESVEFSPQISLEQRTSHRQLPKKMIGKGPYPPPLTSMCGSEGVQVMRPYREGGRLVLEAVTVSTYNAYLQAERADGRLRLCLVNYENKQKICEEEYGEEFEEEEEAETAVDEEVEEEKEEFNNDGNNVVAADWCEEDREANGGIAGREMGIGELPRPRTCKDGGNGNKVMPLPTWGPFCVA